jgi:hypothetical protein
MLDNNNYVGKLVMLKYGSIGIVKSSYWNKFQKEHLYEIEWIKIAEKENSPLCYSLYFKVWEIEEMLKTVKNYKKNDYESSECR